MEASSRLIPHIFLCFLLLIFTLTPMASASVVDVQVYPEEPVQGDTVKVVVRAAPSEKVDVTISFEMEVPVSNGKYRYEINGVSIPAPPNHFTITAVNVKNLHVSVRILIWITKSSEAVNGVATVSQGDIPAGTYDAIIHGDAVEGASIVGLRVKASKTITTDENGYYEYSYDTGSIPPGTFTITADGVTKTITLHERGYQPSPQPPGGAGAPPTPTRRPAEFRVEGLKLNPEARLGEPVRVMVHVRNVGEEEGKYTVRLLLDGKLEEMREVELGGGSSTTISFTLVRWEAGTYTIQVDGQTQPLKVRGELYLPILQTPPKPKNLAGETLEGAEAGKPVLLEAEICNRSILGQETLYIIQVKDQAGRIVHLGFVSGEVPQEASLPFAVEWTPEKPGNYLVEAYAWRSWEEPRPLSEPATTQITVNP